MSPAMDSRTLAAAGRRGGIASRTPPSTGRGRRRRVPPRPSSAAADYEARAQTDLQTQRERIYTLQTNRK
jgi:hypothetical protein